MILSISRPGPGRASALWLVLAALLAVFAAPAHSQSVVLNEVMSSNGVTVADEDGDFSDWIEVFNASPEPVDLGGYGLTDDPLDPFRWTFPDTVIDAATHLHIWASGKARTGATLHASFALKQDGEPLLLFDRDGLLVDSMDLPKIPRDASFGRMPDGSAEWRFFNVPTPGTENYGDGFEAVLAAPEFSQPAGMYTGAIDLELTSPDPGVAIHYTLDGSVPSRDALRYEGPIHIDSREGDPNVLSMISNVSHSYSVWAPPMGEVFKGTVVRSAAFREGSLQSPVVTRTYLVDPGIRTRYTLPIVSLVTDAPNLFDDEMGIYVLGDVYRAWRESNPTARETGGTPANYVQRGKEWERPIHVELFDQEKGLVLAQDAGVRIHGGFSRAYRQKSLRLYARSRYGPAYFEYPVFEEKPIDRYNRLILRNSGQDWTKTLIRDAFMQRLVRHMNVDYQAYQPAILFINGEYWGIQNLRERVDRYYLAGNYSLDAERVDHLEGLSTAIAGDNSHYLALRQFMENNDMSNAASFAHVATQMDVENFIDYQIAQIFIRNNDWPHNNIEFWRHRTDVDARAGAGRDGRWRWILFDTDFGFGWSAMPWDHDTVAWAMDPSGNGHGSWATFLLRKLLANSGFRNQFLSRFADQLNTAFRPEHVIASIDAFERTLEPEIDEHIHRWGHYLGGSIYHQTPADLGEWRDNVDVLRRFAAQRTDVVREHLTRNFGLSGSALLEVDVSDPRAGTVQVNSIRIAGETVGIEDDPYPWGGEYFRKVPIRLVAHPRPGYRLAAWEGPVASTGDTLTLMLAHDTAVTAVFEPDEEWLEGVFPEPHRLSGGPFVFDNWPSDASAGEFPDHMGFYYMDEFDPTLTAAPVGPTSGAYDFSSRTRIEGLGDAGLALINTSNEEGNPGYPGGRLGAAVVALDTRDRREVEVTWTGGTVVPGSRVYNLRLQYRLDDESPLEDVMDDDGQPVAYERNAQAGHAAVIGPIQLPDDVNDRPYVQLWWRYHHTGERLDADVGTRDMLRLDDIFLSSRSVVASEEQDVLPGVSVLRGNFPNPFSRSTTIRYSLARSASVRLEIFNVVGQRVAILVDGLLSGGEHEVNWDPSGLASGVYVMRLETPEAVVASRMLLVR